jgi:very-short-patch-repair endonuclease
MAKHQSLEQLRRVIAETAADWIESSLVKTAELAIQIGRKWGSPIEERLFLGLSIAAQEQRVAVEFFWSHPAETWQIESAGRSPIASHNAAVPIRVGYAPIESTAETIRIFTQVQIEQYRADLFVEWSECGFQYPPQQAVVECDGHDYHERTKEQAKHDRQRDRDVQGFGLPVLRFTGSEIYADTVACGHQILKFLQDADGRAQDSSLEDSIRIGVLKRRSNLDAKDRS